MGLGDPMMVDPGTALLVGVVILVLVAVTLLPRVGLLARWERVRRTNNRVLVEDALKHVYDCEYKRLTCSLQSIAGALGLSEEKATQLVTRLDSRGLLTSSSNALTLTGEGRSYALRVIRIHRLWEHYLADETGLAETEWHENAERQEHWISEDEAEALAERMGNPGFDPHGDPIPTAAGDLPAYRGVPLTDLAPGTVARIIHIEDEPRAVYAQLIAQELYPGKQIRMIEATGERVLFAANEEECILAPMLARNVTVVPLPTEARIATPPLTLASARTGEEVVVTGISQACRGAQRRRLLDLGLVPGTLVVPEMESIGGDPVAYRVRGTIIALRKKQADQLFIQRKEGCVEWPAAN